MIDIFDEIIERFNSEETIQDKKAFLFDLDEVIKQLYRELDELENYCECGNQLLTEKEKINKICRKCK